ncbi:thiamine diphosphokinase [Bifidobacterium aquikefiri]|uniref:thiamine diphosphokinase n=1 Tax=Bifidobacterium aquikefiri TaxID=1653207 RepID=UPI0023F2EB53|nr:thiamine diphosphokinase [Bifidobacterium aquikefiri]
MEDMRSRQHDSNHAESDFSGSKRVCVIFAAGEYFGKTARIPQDAYVIAADGGFDHCLSQHAHADIVMGDFDSITVDVPAGTASFHVPAEKDLTDTASAVTLGWAKGCREFHIYGSLGGRLDHSIANMQLVAGLANHGGIGFLYGADVVVTAIRNGSLTFPAFTCPERTMLSVFSSSDASLGVNERGLKYFLDNATLTNDRSNAVSNEFISGTPSQISVETGTILVTFASEAETPNWSTRVAQEATFDTISTQVTSALNTPGNKNAHLV